MDKVKTFKNGAWTVFGKDTGGLWFAKLYSSGGGLIDKVRCDDYHMAREYLRAFNRHAQSCPR